MTTGRGLYAGPDLIAYRDDDHAAIGPTTKIDDGALGNANMGVQKIIGWDPIPAGAMLKLQTYDLLLQSKTDSDIHDYMEIDLTAWFIVLSPTEAATVVADEDALELIVNQHLTKVEDTAPRNDWAALNDTDGDSDWQVGDTDTSLLYQPDRISLQVLTNPATMDMPIYNRRERLGWLYESAYRPGAAGKIQYGKRYTGQTSRMLKNAAAHAYLVWILTIPGQGQRYTHSPLGNANDRRPSGGFFESLGFLAPQWDLFTTGRAMSGVDMQDWRDWAIQNVNHLDTDGSLLDNGTADADQLSNFRPQPLDVTFHRTLRFQRVVQQPSVVSPHG